MYTSNRIVHEILRDLRGRKGIRQALEAVDDDVYEDMQRHLVEMVSDILFEEETE